MPLATRIVTHASQDRLETLIRERLRRGADRKAIDQRIWDLFGEEWAVMFTDLAGFSRKTADFGIIHFLQVILESQRILIPVIDRHDGILLKLEGDSMLVIFRNVRKAIACAVAMQRACARYNRSRRAAESLLLCLGVGFGRVLRVGDADVFGPEVNAAAKLGENTARAGDILITGSVRYHLPADAKARKISMVPPGARAAYRLAY